ncbi:MAG: hypothetical protein WBB40_02395 [Psychrobacter alimentarius]
MRINLPRWLIIIAALSVVACTPTKNGSHGSGFVAVSEMFWGADHDKPYPFTMDGEISCGIHPEFGPAVYFEPAGFVDESSIGTPLNKAAAESLKQASMTPNVPYSIKKGADLSEAKEIGLDVCGE